MLITPPSANRHGRAYRRAHREGNMAIVTAVSFVVLCGFAALVVDLGYTRMVKAQLQATTDAAALGAVQILDASSAGVYKAHAAGQLLAGMNSADGRAVAISDNLSNDPVGTVVVGHYDNADGSFTVTHDEAQANAVMVRAARDDLSPMFAGVAFGEDKLEAGACTLAVQQPPVGAETVPWYLPFALPSCIFDQYTETELLTKDFKLNPAGIDNTGWARVGASANASWARDHIAGIEPCMADWAGEGGGDGHVTEPCAEASIGDTLYLNNGAVQSALAYLDDEMMDGINWNPTHWGDLWGTQPAKQATSTKTTAEYNQVFAGPVPIFDGGTSYCSSSASWNGTQTITGFAWGVIYDMRSTGKASDRTIWMRVDPDDLYNVGSSWGGPNLGVTKVPPARAYQCPV